jgi:uncharacterized protein (TIGR03663 family)
VNIARLEAATGIAWRARARAARIRVSLTSYEAAFGAIVALALVLRVVELTAKPFHHDESQHAWFALRLVEGDGYQYDPVYHGPLQFYSMSLLYLVIGIGDVAARLSPALFGTAMVALPYFLRHRLGSTAALAAASLLCISPSYVYFSRFVREDIYVACLTLALIAAVFGFLARPRPWHPPLVLGLLAASFAAKETTYITVFVGCLFFIGLAIWQTWSARWAGRAIRGTPFVRTLASVGRDAWIWGICTFAAVYTLLFTTFLTNPRGLQDGIVESLSYWLSQQPVARGNQPWFYYLVLLPGYELPILLLALVGIGAVLRRPTLLGAFLIWDFVASLLVYSWASERMPWLVLHPLLPVIMLGALGVQAIWNSRSRMVGKLGLALAVAGAAWSVAVAVGVAYVRPADPSELLVYTQTSTDVPGTRTELLALERRAKRQLHRPLTIEIDSWTGVGWPWGWYLRIPAGYPDMSQSGYVPSGDVVVVAEPNRALVAPHLQQYVGRRYRLRVWWVPEWNNATVGDWARWFATRRTWSPKASLDEWLYVRRRLFSARAS